MSPKKTTGSKRSADKMRTVRKEKPRLNRPANIKVSIPIHKNTEEGIHIPIVRGRGPPRFKKNLDLQTQVELANSVARQQLVKEEPALFKPNNVVFINSPKNRGRPKKVQVVSDFFQNRVVVDTAEDIVTSTARENNAPKKKPIPKNNPKPTRRIVTRKRLADSRAQEVPKRTKVEPKTDAETLNPKIKLEDDAHVVDVPVEPDSNPVVEPQSTVVQPQPTLAQPEPKVLKPQPKAKKTRSAIKVPQLIDKKPSAMKLPAPASRKRGPRGKQENVGGGVKSSAIGDLLRKRVSEGDVKINQSKQNAPGLVESRKTSVSSSSSKSWTRDISSSSNNTCVGSVCSNDFVRINKKLPVLKLTNVDNELKKRRINVQETVASAKVDEADEDLSDPYDSDSSDSERKFSQQLNNSIDANSLRLSASSPPSSPFSQSRKKESSTDYAKAADKLSLTMEKLDLEIINWISSENEDVNANLAKFRDKMFDILDNEFGVITHCRRLKEILEPPKVEDIVDEACISDQVRDCDANNVIENTTIKENTPVKENAKVQDNALDKDKALVKDKDPDIENAPVEEIVKDFVKPRPSRKLSSTSEGNISNASTTATRDEISEDETPAGTSYNYPYYHHDHDDDDTLSLFAESISGFEPSRMNTSTVSVPVANARPVEEYVPKPVKEDCLLNAEKHTYCPTKIREDAEIMTSKIIPICEKQNADSTSIYKQSNSTDDAESYQSFNENTDLDTRIGPPDMIKKPRLMDSLFEGLPKTRSVVFGKLCFYNLMNCCRKVFFGQCRFLHMIPTSAQIKEKLNLLDERMLIQEYLLLRNWPELRRRYGMCYVEECAKRGLTRILVEMAYDFIVKARNESEEDTRLRVDTIEITLLHLNNVDLSICEDLLKLTIHSDQVNRTLLCDVFMATMSITQNFSRFKVVFLNLTYFMVDNDRSFNKDVVEHILERVCILPFEESIARALIQMMRLTKSDIFKNSMIGHLEKQISANKDVFEEYTLLKNQCAFTSMLASSVMSENSPLKLDTQSVRPDRGDPQPPVASPDTTNLDNRNKTVEEPSKSGITRTIGMNPPIISNPASTSPGLTPAHVSPGTSRGHASSGSPTSDDSVKLNIRKWRNRSIFPHILPPPMAIRPTMHTPIRTPMRPQMRPQMRPPQRMPFNQRLVTFKCPSNYVNRQPGPKY